VPREVHETYTVNPDDPDAEAVLTGYVVVTRESEWDENSRARALGLVDYEESLDRVSGLPRAEAYRKQPFMVHTVTNYAEKAVQAQKRKDREAHKKDADGWDDGLNYVAVVAKPDDLTTRR
jgi:hypothetical protein